MITEDYVSFETAKLLKEKGYKGSFNGYYNNAGCVVDKPNFFLKAPEYQYYERVSLQMAMKWLREVHNLCIEPYRTACGYLYTISTIPYGSCIYNPKEGGDDEDSDQWTSYEGACEAAIKYCLTNLI